MPSLPVPAPATPSAPAVHSPLAGLLSYLVPGLGQIFQGRVAKGLLFMVCLYGMFFYGMALGEGKNVYLPDTTHNGRPATLPPLAVNLYNRPQFLGQFWIGIAAWPAIWQYNRGAAAPADDSLWGDLERTPPEQPDQKPAGYQGKSLNELIREGDKTWDLGWVYTVIAGVLNILVIYDAFAGPAYVAGAAVRPQPAPAAAVG